MDIRNYFSAPNTTKKLEKKTSAEKPSKDTAIKKKKPKRRIPDSDDELSDPNKASKSNTSTPSRQSTRLVQKKIKVKDEPKVKVEDKVEVKPKRKSKVKDEPKSASESEEIVNKKSVRSIRSKTTKSNSNEVDDDEISPYNSTSENLEIFSSPRSSTRKSTLVERKTPETTPKKRQSFEANISDDDYFPPEEEALPTKKTKHEQKNVEEKSPSKRAIKSPRSKKGKPHDVDNDEDEMNIAETTDQIKNKTGPTASESKEIPQGEDMCLFGKTFVFTGDLDTLDREEAQDIVKRNGGRVTLQPSSRTSYVVVGKDPGPKKMEKVEQFKIPTLNEEQLLELIRTSPKKSSSDVASIKKSPKSKAPITKISEAIASVTSTDANGTQLWTEKYRPKHLRDFCGNQNLVKDMIKWLNGWNEKSFKFKSKEWMPALLISGPPGIGKTSSVHLIAGLEGYEVIELNASDTRSKKTLEAAIKVATKNTSITGFFYPVNDKTSGKEKAKDVQKKRTLILMDELDGMSSGDRGGIAELIQLIKKTRIPIVCVCNDINSQKFKSLKTYCHEARFSKPRVEQIRSRIMTIATRENLEIRPTDVDELIRGSNSDIRQILNILSSWKINHDSIDYDEIKALNKTNEKHLRKSLFEISKDFLSNDIWKSRKNTFNDKMKLYFQEHDLIPLMIFENYIKMKPHTITKFIKKHDNEDIKPDVLEKLASLEAFAKAADSMSYGDMVDKRIRGPRQEWNLMPMHGYFSTIAPAYYVHGFNKGGQFGQYKFPSWLGQNSKAQKIQRQLKEIQSHIRTKVSADRGEIRESYIPTLRKALIKPLVVNKADGMIDVINFMDQYMITKEQFDTIMEFKDEQTRYNGSDIPSTTKASFTRKYNATSHPLPFLNVSNVVTTKVNKPVITADLDDFVIEEVVPDDDDVVEDEDDLTKDRLIKQPSAGRGGGRGGGRGSRGSRGASRGTSRGGSRGGRGSRGSRKERK